ncbi:hypothetical protein OUZ56_010087 [Daphnia magna]|uniref:Uncharacterized protein n=1 Tax=Daphnia magna TaxID=35525 RepID=A0ABR0AHS3_9CRUS|nr:hypothetical protein OUZ56_010087 [Daphnia magna]
MIAITTGVSQVSFRTYLLPFHWLIAMTAVFFYHLIGVFFSFCTCYGILLLSKRRLVGKSPIPENAAERLECVDDTILEQLLNLCLTTNGYKAVPEIKALIKKCKATVKLFQFHSQTLAKRQLELRNFYENHVEIYDHMY